MSVGYSKYTGDTKKNTLIIPSETKRISEIEPFITSIECCSSLSQAQLFNILIALTEAVNNAIVHAHKSDASKNVEISVVCLNDGVMISVRDYGAGFKPEDVPDPRDDGNLLRTHGRGVFLMKQLASNVQFHTSENGTTTVMHFIRK